jgi:hypothetical protein
MSDAVRYISAPISEARLFDARLDIGVWRIAAHHRVSLLVPARATRSTMCCTCLNFARRMITPDNLLHELAKENDDLKTAIERHDRLRSRPGDVTDFGLR